ncbi:MAG: hypothetical protein U0527_15660 [Candidatus Eisenbacteria bacterium]
MPSGASPAARETPRGGRRGGDPLAILDPAFQPFRRDFEEAAGKVRLVLVVAPTCGECNVHTFEIHDQLLHRVKDDDLAVFVLWCSILPTDVEPRARLNAKRWVDPRGLNYWDENGQIARAFGRMLNLDPGQPAFDCYFLYDRDATFDPEGTMEKEGPDFRALKSGWVPAAPVARWTSNRNVRLPGFNWEAVEARCLELLGGAAGGESPK